MASGKANPIRKKIYYRAFTCSFGSNNIWQHDENKQYYNGRYWRVTSASSFNLRVPRGYTAVLAGFYTGSVNVTTMQVSASGIFNVARIGTDSGTYTGTINVMFVPNEMITG